MPAAVVSALCWNVSRPLLSSAHFLCQISVTLIQDSATRKPPSSKLLTGTQISRQLKHKETVLLHMPLTSPCICGRVHSTYLPGDVNQEVTAVAVRKGGKIHLVVAQRMSASGVRFSVLAIPATTSGRIVEPQRVLFMDFAERASVKASPPPPPPPHDLHALQCSIQSNLPHQWTCHEIVTQGMSCLPEQDQTAVRYHALE